MITITFTFPDTQSSSGPTRYVRSVRVVGHMRIGTSMLLSRLPADLLESVDAESWGSASFDR